MNEELNAKIWAIFGWERDGFCWRNADHASPSRLDYSGSMAGAMQLVELASKSGWSFSFARQSDGICQATFLREGCLDDIADWENFDKSKCVLGSPSDSPSEAICSAFLKLPKNESRK